MNPEQFGEERTQQFSDDAQVKSGDDPIEIAADTLEHVAGGTGGGGGVGHDPQPDRYRGYKKFYTKGDSDEYSRATQ